MQNKLLHYTILQIVNDDYSWSYHFQKISSH